MVGTAAVSRILTLLLYVHGVTDGSDNGETKLESRFATKNTYMHKVPEENSSPWTNPNNLRPIMIDATLRHGTRFPNKKSRENWKAAVRRAGPLIKSSGNFPDVAVNISLWEDKLSNDSHNNLSSLGCEEHVSLGFTYFSMMPKLFTEVLNHNGVSDDHDLLLLTSSETRAKASAKAFLRGLENAKNGLDSHHADRECEENKVKHEFNQINKENVLKYGNLSVVVNDTLLRFFDHCEKYTQFVKNNDAANLEFENFFKTEGIKNIFHRFHGIEDYKDIFHIYQLCAFEKAVYNDSTWCSVFSYTELDALAYANDLKHYYLTGPGYDINFQQACHLLQHIFDRFMKRPDNGFRATLRFGHAETLIPLVNLLGFYMEDYLTADNYHEKGGRAFQTGKISPFAGNLAIVVYESDSDSDESQSGSDKLFISFVLNEQILKPLGLNCEFCEFQTVYHKMREKLDGCQYVCSVGTFTSVMEIFFPPTFCLKGPVKPQIYISLTGR